MKIEQLLCNSCGAALKVPDHANYIKCNHCGVQLHVQRDSDSTFTEQLDEIASRTDHLERELARLKRNEAVAELDRQWEIERQQWLIKSENDGPSKAPTVPDAVLLGILIGGGGFGFALVCFAVNFEFIAIGNWGGGPTALTGIIIAIVGIVISRNYYHKAVAYNAAHWMYLHRRGVLLGEHEVAPEVKQIRSNSKSRKFRRRKSN